MEHLVRFTSAEGRDAFHTASNLDEALKFVERLRNNEEVEQVRLFRMQEVPIEFKAYYKVEVRAGEETGVATPAEAEVSPVDAEAPAMVPPVDDATDGQSLSASSASTDNGSGRRLFGRTS